MITSRNLGKLVTHFLICSLFVAGLSCPTTRASRAYANQLPPPRAVQKTADQAVVPRAETLDDAARARVEEAYVKLPLSFEENRGQVDAEVKYLARGAGYTLFLTQTEAVLSLRGAEGEARNQKGGLHRRREPRLATRSPRSDVLRMKLKGANRSPAVTAENRTGVRANYFKGNDPKNWHTGVARFERVRYADVYPGIDVIYYGQEQQLEYDFEVAAGADAGRIVLEFAGVGRVRVERKTGELVLKTAGGEVRQRRPVAYQEVGGERREVASRYVLKGRNRVGIEVGEYDRAKRLVIDPVITYSTYLGGTSNDFGYAIAADASGNAYVAGFTQSPDFPTFHQYQKNRDAPYYADAFVLKINTNASGKDALLYSTYLGGTASCCTIGTGVAVDSSGIIYVTGVTAAPDFPLLNPYQTYRGGVQFGDAFLVKLDPNLSGADSLLHSTYLGGTDDDYAAGVAVDSAGHAYVAGYTASTDFPIINPYRVKRRGQDAFVTRIDTNASGAAQLVYSTFLGGSRDDYATGIAADSAGHAYVAGYTASTDFPMFHAYKRDFHTTWDYQRAAFVTKLDTNLSGAASLLYSTYLVGSDDGFTYGALAWAIAADSAGNAYVTGQTSSRDFPTLNQYQTQCYDGSDAFVTKLDTNLSGAASLRYSTYLCGSGGFDDGYGIAVDSSGNVYVTGWTVASDFPELNPSQKYVTETNSDIFVAKLNPNLSGRASLIYSTLLIGNNEEKGLAIATDSLGNAYVTGETRSGTLTAGQPVPCEKCPRLVRLFPHQAERLLHRQGARHQGRLDRPRRCHRHAHRLQT